MLVFTFDQLMELEHQAKVPGNWVCMGRIFLCSFDPIWGVILEFCLEGTKVYSGTTIFICFAVIFLLTFTVAIVHLEIL